MTESTSNHNWTIPEVGGSKDVWGQILNDFFDDELDEEVSLKGPFSERPSAGSGVAKLYLATDRRIVYYNDGTSWEAVYGLGTEDNPVPDTSHFESIQAERLDSTDFIAWDGDGDANTFLSEAGDGSTVYIPAGTYQKINPREGQTVIASRAAVFDGAGSDTTLRLEHPDAKVVGGIYKNSNDNDSIRFNSANCIVDSVVVESSGRHGVFFGSSDNKNMISNFVVSEVPGTEVLVSGDDNKISDGRVDGNIDNSGSNNAVDNDSIVFL